MNNSRAAWRLYYFLALYRNLWVENGHLVAILVKMLFTITTFLPAITIKMLIKTLLNFVTDYKCFRFGNVSFIAKGTATQHIIAEIHPRKNSQPLCPKCHEACKVNYYQA